MGRGRKNGGGGGGGFASSRGGGGGGGRGAGRHGGGRGREGGRAPGVRDGGVSRRGRARSNNPGRRAQHNPGPDGAAMELDDAIYAPARPGRNVRPPNPGGPAPQFQLQPQAVPPAALVAQAQLPPLPPGGPPQLYGYRRVAPLGRGEAGDVYLEMQNCHGTERPVAVKYQQLQAVDAVAVRNELCNLRKLEHPNIVSYLTSFACDTHLAIVMECCVWDNGLPHTLHSFLHQERPNGLSEAEAQNLTAQLLTAVAAAHKASVVHRDINPHNILIQTVGGRHLIKLADFGASKECQFTVPRTYRSTAPEFTAPERLRSKWLAEQRKAQPPAPRERGAEDLWAVGVVVLSALHGRAPFDSFNSAVKEWLATDIAARGKLVPIMRAALEQLAPRVTPGCCDLLLRLLTDDPNARPRAEDLLREHPWVNVLGYVKDDSHVPALLAAHGGRQSEAAFEDVLRRATRGTVPQRMQEITPPPGYVFDRWGAPVPQAYAHNL